MIIKQEELKSVGQVKPNSLILGDCLEAMKFIADKSIDMVNCDLPYGTTACKWDVIIPFEPLWAQYKRIIKDNGTIVLSGSQPFTSMLIMSNLEMFKYEWIWDKGVSGSFANAKYQPLKTHENILIFSHKNIYNPQMNKRKKPARIGGVNSGSTQGGRNIIYNSTKLSNKKIYDFAFPKTIQYVSPRSVKNDRGKHPTQKPVALYEYLIKTYTNEGDLVLDNCAGSFTTAVACDNLNRKWICIEQEQKYCEIGEKRIEENKQRLKLLNNNVQLELQ